MRNKIPIALSFLLIGCPKVAPPPPVPPPVAPVFEKTHGEITVGGIATLHIRYKDINILIDPVFESLGTLGAASQRLERMKTPGFIERTRRAGLQIDGLPPMDYLLLTDTQVYHFGPIARKSLRKNLKILTTPDNVAGLQAGGFNQAKGLSNGQRILLKKNDGFLFVNAVQSRNPVSGRVVNGYLLEFDNGKNIFISGETVDEAVVRDFVYGLRDDGKEIEFAFIYGGGLRSAEEGLLQSSNEELAAVFIGLVQPRFGILLQADSLDVARTDESRLRTLLKDEIYSGGFFVPSPGETIPF